MVAVIVSDHNVVDLVDAGELCGSRNAIGISVVEAGPPGIDEHRLPGGADEERCLSAFHVNEIDVERTLSFCQTRQR